MSALHCILIQQACWGMESHNFYIILLYFSASFAIEISVKYWKNCAIGQHTKLKFGCITVPYNKIPQKMEIKWKCLLVLPCVVIMSLLVERV